MRRLAVGLLCLVGCGFDPKPLDPNAVVPEVRFAFSTSVTDETVGNATVFVELSEPTTNEVTVGIGVIEGGTASDGSDYDLQQSEITFEPGLRSIEVPIAIVSDSLAESDENLLLELRAPRGATLGATTTHDLKISANILPKISFQTGTQALAEGITTQQFPVQLDGPSTSDVLFAYSVTGSATLGSDHQFASGMLTIPAGTTMLPINAAILDDPTDEDDETIDVSLTALSGAVVGQNRTRQHKIVDDDLPPILGFTAAAATTPETGTATITVTLAIASAKTVSASYSVAAGSASTADFTTTAGTVTFAPGVTSQTFTVTITPDNLDEPDETITISLGNLVNGTAGTLTQELTITDDDNAPNLAFESESSDAEEDRGDRTIRIRLSDPSGQNVSFNISITGTATRGERYDVPNGPFTIAAGATTFDLPVDMQDTPGNQGSQTAIFTLTTPSNATLGTPATHTLTITE
jgi:hypothetical protein